MVGILSVEVVVGLVCASISLVIGGDVFAAIMVVADCFFVAPDGSVVSYFVVVGG